MTLAAALAFLVFAVTHAVLLALALRGSGSLRRTILCVLLAGLVCDNLVLAVGNMLHGTPWFDPATRLRFFLHAAILPFLNLYTRSAMQAAGLQVAGSAVVRAGFWAITLFALAHGITHDVIGLGALREIESMGLYRMTAVTGGVPVGTILTNGVMILAGLCIWRGGGPGALFLGSAAIFLINGFLTRNPFGFIIGNLAEVIFAAALLCNERVLARRETHAGLPRE